MKQAKEYIEELLERFFDGQTTESEEQLLSDYFCDADAVPEEWQVYKDIFDSFKADVYDFNEEELNAMLAHADDKKPKAVRLLPWASAACVAAIVGLLVWNPWVENPSSETPSITQEKLTEKATKDSAEERVHESTILKQNNSTFFAEAKPITNKHYDKEVLPQQKKENNIPRPIKEAKQTAQPSNSKEITTSELLETINLLVDVGNENITLTSLPYNEGFVVKTVSYGGESNSYMLRRCAKSSSLELKSQVINF